MINFDHASTTREYSSHVQDAIASYIGRAYSLELMPSLTDAVAVHDVRDRIAIWLDATPRQVILTTGATEALNLALANFGHGDRVVAMTSSHSAVTEPLKLAEQRGAEVVYSEITASGITEFTSFAQCLAIGKSNQATAVVVCHGSNVTGEVLDINRILELTAGTDIKIICDAAQTAGILPLPQLASSSNHGVTALAFSAHKGLGGLVGAGVLAVAPSFVPKHVLVGGGGGQTFIQSASFEPRSYEVGTRHGVATAVLGAVIQHQTETERLNKWQNLQKLRRYAYHELSRIKELELFHANCDTSLPIISFRHKRAINALLASEMYQAIGVNSRYGNHCAPLLHERLGTNDTGLIRFSFGQNNTESEVDTAVSYLKQYGK